jgi:hypothetical protein
MHGIVHNTSAEPIGREGDEGEAAIILLRDREDAVSFGPIKQVGVSVSIGFPLLVVGVLIVLLLVASWVGTATLLWILGACLVVAGLLAAISRRVI